MLGDMRHRFDYLPNRSPSEATFGAAIILVLSCLTKDDGSSQTGSRSASVHPPVSHSLTTLRKYENDNVPAVLFQGNRLRLYNTCIGVRDRRDVGTPAD